MLTALALASSLWVAAHEAGARADVPKPVVPVEQIADSAGRDIAWLVAGNAADLYSTAWALERCNGGCGEANPAGFNAEARIALKMATTATTGLILWKLRRDGHGKAATIIRWLSVAGHLALVTNNVYRGSRQR